MNLKVTLGKFELLTPIIIASGTYGFGEELSGLADFKSIGAITAKTITLNPRIGNPPPRIFETECGVLNSVGLENPGLEGFIAEKLSKLKNLPAKFIVSAGGFFDEEYEQICEKLNNYREIEAIELNFSCPNLKSKKIISQDCGHTAKLVANLRRRTQKTLIVKITSEVTDLVEIARAVKDNGADALCLINTLFGMAIDVNKRKPILGNIFGGYSGPAIKPVALYSVWQVARSVDIPIIGGGGIKTANDALEFILAGAAAVSLGTINLVYPDSASDVLRGIKAYMSKYKIGNINDLRGKLNID